MPANRADFRAYALARGDNAPTAALDSAVDAALVRASDYIRTRYWPRLGLADPAEDQNVIEAIYMAARREVVTPGFWSTTITPTQAKTLVQVDSIRWQPAEKALAGLTGRDLVVPMDPAIDALLLPYGFVPGALTV